MAIKITIEDIWNRIPEEGRGYISRRQIAQQYSVSGNTIAKKIPQIKSFLIEKLISGEKVYSRKKGLSHADVFGHNEH